MENYLKLLKGVAFLMLFSLLPLPIFAQATIDKMINEYVATSINGENATPYASRINQLYKGYDKESKTLFKDNIYNRIKSCSIPELRMLREKMAYIDLYMLVSEAGDEKHDDLYFMKGEICGLHTGDTIGLKECITELKQSVNSKTPKIDGYICTLIDYLGDIRGFKPTSQTIDGIWISNCSLPGDLMMTPAYILIISNGKAKLELSGYAYAFTEIIHWGKLKVKNRHTHKESLIEKMTASIWHGQMKN